MTKFCAYLSIYNDWDLLAPSLASMRKYIDELVVVDGAYEWMSSYLESTGRDPRRSDRRLYDIVEDSGIPARFINRTWNNEVEKRAAGFASCESDFVFRIDADEIIFINEHALDNYLASGSAIGEMEMPLYNSPGYIHAVDHVSPLGKQPLIFDKNQVSAEQHLQYLWLVLTADKLPEEVTAGATFAEQPVAFNAHLSTWRTTEGATQRAAFYVMNWMRANGASWIPDLEGRPLTDFGRLFEYMTPQEFLSALSRSKPANGHYEMFGSVLRKSPLTSDQDKSFSFLYNKHLSSSFDLNRAARREKQAYICGNELCFDITGLAGRNTLISGNNLIIESDDIITGAKSQLQFLLLGARPRLTIDLPLSFDNNLLNINLSELADPSVDELRCVLTVSLWCLSSRGVSFFRVL